MGKDVEESELRGKNVLVVRCRDCKYLEVEKTADEMPVCIGLYCSRTGAPVRSTGLCDYFERARQQK